MIQSLLQWLGLDAMPYIDIRYAMAFVLVVFLLSVFKDLIFWFLDRGR